MPRRKGRATDDGPPRDGGIIAEGLEYDCRSSRVSEHDETYWYRSVQDLPASMPLAMKRTTTFLSPRTIFAVPFVAIVAGLATALPALAETIDATVVSFPEGETIVVRDSKSMKHEIKLSGIELIEQGQPHFRESRRFLSALLFSKSVRVQWNRRDNRGWLIGTVYLSPPESRCLEVSCPKTMDVGLALLQGGLAWHKRNDADQMPEEQIRYAAAEELARSKRVGLWSDAKPIPPWEWRERTIVRELRRSGPER